MEIFTEATPDEKVQLLRNALVFLCDDDNFDIHSDGADKIAVAVVQRYIGKLQYERNHFVLLRSALSRPSALSKADLTERFFW